MTAKKYARHDFRLARMTTWGAAAFGVIVFATAMSTASTDIVDKEPPVAVDLSKLGPFSSVYIPEDQKKATAPMTVGDARIPVFLAEAARESIRPGVRSEAKTGGARAPGDPCTCDSECADLDVVGGCQIGVCAFDNVDQRNECEVQNAPVGMPCDADGTCDLSGAPCVPANLGTDCPDTGDNCSPVFCTLDVCNTTGVCVPDVDSTGTCETSGNVCTSDQDCDTQQSEPCIFTKTPCARECVGGTRPGLFCDETSDCPGTGAACQQKPNGVCNEVDDRCEVDIGTGTLGRCCDASGVCSFTIEGDCSSGLWYRLGDPSDLNRSCECPKYSSGIAPEGTEEVIVSPVLPSPFMCEIGGVRCEGNGSADCEKRCVSGDNDGGICENDLECALAGTCDDGSNDPCIPSLQGADCTGGGSCVANDPGSCLPDNCIPDPDACNPVGSFLNIGDDYTLANGSYLRLSRFRFRGGVEEPNGVLVFEFYDKSSPPKRANAFAVRLPTTGVETWTVTLDCFPDCDPSQPVGSVWQSEADPPFIIPPAGYVVMRSSRAVGNEAVGLWVATTSPADAGSNNADGMWIDGTPDVNHLGTGNNVLMFEIIGTKVDPLGACCDPSDPQLCQDTPIWGCGRCADGSGTPCSQGRECGISTFCTFDNWQGPTSADDFRLGEGKLCAEDACTAGACCDPTDGACTEIDGVTCTTSGRDFLGFGTSCVPNCCGNPANTGADCACDRYQCSTDGGTTFTGVDCSDNPAVCTGGDTCELICPGPTPFALELPWQCEDPNFGGPLVPSVPCSSGAAGDALCNSVEPGSTCTIPLFGATNRYTFEGDSTGASFTLTEGDDCTLDSDDPGWYEAFTLTANAVVTIDHCCDPGAFGIKTPVWIVLEDGCPCGAGGGQTVSPDTNELGIRGGFGPGCNAAAGCCEDGNYAATFTLRPGTYTWQIAGGAVCSGNQSDCATDDDCPVGQQCLTTTGPYTGHFSVERAPLAACCTGESCVVTDRLDCNDLNGNWLGGGDQPVVRCPPDIPNPCLSGSCCTGPGQCDDGPAFDTLGECETAGSQNVYHGGVTCDEDPCPVCDFRNDGNCKFDDGNYIFYSDRALVGNITDPQGCPAYIRRAENFRPAADTITRICWWPAYLDPFVPAGQGECANNPPPDDFLIRFYQDDAGVPGQEIGPIGGQALVPDAKKWRGGNSRVWEMSGTLNTPITVNPNDCYWVEITGFGEYDGNNGCTVFVLESLEGDGYAMEDADGTYGPEDVQYYDPNPNNVLADGADIAYCISSGFASNNDCNDAELCCLCDAPAQFLPPLDCFAAGGITLSGQTDPAACPLPATNDLCATPEAICAGQQTCTVDFDTRCADTDGPTNSCFAVAGPGVGSEFIKDLWYTYEPPCSGNLSVSTCEGTMYDSMVAVYESGATCECPTTTLPCGTGIGQDPTCVCDDNNGDPGCSTSCFPTSEVTMPVQSGDCYVIRVGGDHGSEVLMSGAGTLTLNLDCPTVQAPVTAPPPHNILKNRYISIDALTPNPGLVNFDIKVTLTDSIIPGLVTPIGTFWWAAQPAPDGRCLSVLSTTRPAVPPDWTGCSTIHLTGCPVNPTSTYDIAVVDGVTESAPLTAFTQAKPGVKWFGDAVGQFNGSEWTAPQGAANIDDALAAIKTWQNPGGPNATHVSVTDIHPNLPGLHNNLLVNFDDVFQFVKGFQGNPWPGVGPCP